MKCRNVPLLMLCCALLGLTACEKDVDLSVVEEVNSENIVGHYEMYATVSGEKGKAILDLFKDRTGYVVFNGNTTIAINEITYSLDESSITFYGGTMINGTYEISKNHPSSLKLTKGSQTFDFTKESDNLISRMTECRWRLKRSSYTDYISLDFNGDMTGLWLDYHSYKNQRSYTFTYTLDPSTNRLKMNFNDGTYSEYDYVCVSGSTALISDLLLFWKENGKYMYQKFDYYTRK